jgi:uncharacterized membrane protein
VNLRIPTLSPRSFYQPSGYGRNPNQTIPKASRNTSRLEAFSDGVFAIAITLLVLDIKVPRDLPANTSLASALLAQWPAYLAFVTSFATIGIMWINHHRQFNLINMNRSDALHPEWSTVIGNYVRPFPTELAAEYLLRPDQATAAMLYNGWRSFLLLPAGA